MKLNVSEHQVSAQTCASIGLKGNYRPQNIHFQQKVISIERNLA